MVGRVLIGLPWFELAPFAFPPLAPPPPPPPAEPEERVAPAISPNDEYDDGLDSVRTGLVRTGTAAAAAAAGVAAVPAIVDVAAVVAAVPGVVPTSGREQGLGSSVFFWKIGARRKKRTKKSTVRKGKKKKKKTDWNQRLPSSRPVPPPPRQPLSSPFPPSKRARYAQKQYSRFLDCWTGAATSAWSAAGLSGDGGASPSKRAL